jgi:hypothetical protein
MLAVLYNSLYPFYWTECGLLSKYEQKFDMFTKGEWNVTENEMELLRMIREHDDPERALVIAVEVITSFLGLRGSSEEPAADDQPEQT